MATKTTFIATAPDGTEFTRKTSRIYTHAVLVFVGDNATTGKPGHWGYLSFNSREELALAEANRWTGHTIFADGDVFEKVIVVPAVAKV